MKQILLLFAVLITISCNPEQNKAQEESALPFVMTVLEFFEWYETEENKPTFLNFWATWCKPCVAEMPLLMKAAEENPELPFFFFSLDNADIENEVQAMIKNRNWQGQFHLVDVTDFNEFINKVSEEWGGGIPFSIILGNKNTMTHEGDFENIAQINQFINQSK
jgi:thiol-disulfide isomerase/thioredoxin